MGQDQDYSNFSTPMYELHCKPSFDSINKKLDRLVLSIDGNGTVGIKTRLDRLEVAQRNWQSLYRPVIVAVLTALVMGIVFHALPLRQGCNPVDQEQEKSVSEEEQST